MIIFISTIIIIFTSSVQLDDIHGCHGQTSSIHQTSDVTVQLNIVEAVLGSFNLARI